MKIKKSIIFINEMISNTKSQYFLIIALLLSLSYHVYMENINFFFARKASLFIKLGCFRLMQLRTTLLDF